MNKLTVKKSNPIIEKAAELREQGRAELMNLESFIKALNRPPAVIKENKYANNSKYVPIGHIQTLLDTLFFSLWETKNFQYTVIGNEIAASIELWVFHPVVKKWIVRQGAAGTQIRLNKGAALTDMSQKIKNAIEMDLPHALADALKSAAKTLGPAFGRDLNRDHKGDYKAPLSGFVQKNTYNVNEVKEALQTLNTENDIFEYWETQPLWQQDPKIVALFEERKRDLNDEQF